MKENDFREILVGAIRKEGDAAVLYDTYAHLAKIPNVKKMFEEMASEERKHQKLLEQVTEEKVEKYQLNPIPDLKISEFSSDDVEFSPQMSYQEALLLAIKREENAHKLYLSLKNSVDEDKLKKLFSVLAQEEAKHKLNLETEYDKGIFSED
jgi:rubrerythrin